MTDNRLYISNQRILPIQSPITNKPQSEKSKTSNAGFEQVLSQALGGVKFSQHASQRLQTRNINLSQIQLAQLNSAVDKAAQKGARESLVLMNNDLALVVSVTNRTVITAMDGASIKDNVFTNIDSAVIV
ncbi:MAG: TIGR02530 family flagellar biosynthesis protein [Negativicutes bacterium]